jgi:hypothetical protein
VRLLEALAAATRRAHTTVEKKELHELLVDAWVRLAELIEVCAKQREQGNLKVDQQTFVRAQRVLDEIAALEDMMRPTQR